MQPAECVEEHASGDRTWNRGGGQNRRAEGSIKILRDERVRSEM
jgi:hypothetical protein